MVDWWFWSNTRKMKERTLESYIEYIRDRRNVLLHYQMLKYYLFQHNNKKNIKKTRYTLNMNIFRLQQLNVSNKLVKVSSVQITFF